MLRWLRETDPQRLEDLWRRADAVRREHVGDAVHLRGLIEISNHCVRTCGYCGLRAPNRTIERYRMSPDEIVACAELAVRLGYGTVVLQAGEDPQLTRDWVADVVQRIKRATRARSAAGQPLAITLSLGEVERATLAAWKDAGADRYLLRFETSNPELLAQIHPPLPGPRPSRMQVLGWLRELGFEVGSGAMIGIPGQTWDDLARDLELFRELDLDMIGVGPWLPHPQTPLGKKRDQGTEGSRDQGEFADDDCSLLGRSALDPLIPRSLDSSPQVPNDELTTYKVLALARLLCPDANIPSTTALATLNRTSGRELGLQRGANIVMPNLTPPAYRCKYEIYPAKACLYETAEQCHGCLTERIRALGRTIGTGTGPSPNWRRRFGGGEELREDFTTEAQRHGEGCR